MDVVLENIYQEMDLPSFFKWLDEGPVEKVREVEGEQSLVPVLSERAETLMTNVVNSAREDVQQKLQQMVSNIRLRVRP